MVNILAFAEVSNIAGVHINMDISKEKVINIQIQYGIIIQFKACAEGLFYTKFMTQVWSLILLMFPLTPTLTYPPLK